MNNIISIKAKIKLKSTSEGGRKGGIASGYRPNHVFELPGPNEMLLTHIGEIIFEHAPMIYPGEVRMVTIRFLKTPAIEKFLQSGRTWFINEAAKTVGYGEIIEILET